MSSAATVHPATVESWRGQAQAMSTVELERMRDRLAHMASRSVEDHEDFRANREVVETQLGIARAELDRRAEQAQPAPPSEPVDLTAPETFWREQLDLIEASIERRSVELVSAEQYRQMVLDRLRDLRADTTTDPTTSNTNH